MQPATTRSVSSCLTRRDNLRKILRGQTPQWVPFAPNFGQWYQHHRAFGTLPQELAGAVDYVDAMKLADCDIFSRNLDAGFREIDTRLPAVVENVSTDLGQRTVREYRTPRGVLRRVDQEQASITTSHCEEYFVKDWETDGDAFNCVLDQRQYAWDVDAFIKVDEQIGDWGLVNVPFGCTPLKFLHQFFGMEYTCLFVNDYPDEAERICRTYWKQLRPCLIELAEHPRVESVILMDNVDTPFYPPDMARQFWTPYVKDAADLMRSHGKHLFVHACGKLAGLSPIFAECRVSGLEGIAHPPLGDWPAHEAQKCHKDFIFIGGFSAHEQDVLDDQQVRAFYRDYLPRAQKDRFIFAASCQTTIRTTWQRMKMVREICRAWGGMPHVSPVEA